MKFIDLFSGIGGFRSALEELGHDCIAFSEIDKFAIKSYKAIYDTDGEIELGNISEISDEYISELRGEVDLVVGGSPCQSFSVAGNRGGFEDTRGTLFFDYARTVADIKPKYFIYENVKGMISHDKSNTIKTVLNTFNELGYYIDFNIFNSKNYGVPQNRERIYIVGKRKDLVPSPKFHEKKKRKIKVDEIHNWAVEHIEFVELLPKLKSNVDTRLIDVLEDDVDESFYLTKKQTQNMSIDDDLSGRLNQYNFRERDIIHSPYKVSPTLNTMQGGDRQPKIAIKNFKEMVEVRKHSVSIEELQKTLREAKKKTKLTTDQISTTLDVPKTKVEHWFRTDSSFSIPDKEVWCRLKNLLEIETSEFDKSITEFVLKESEFDTTNRVYDPNHLSPTINSTTEPKIAVVGNTSRTKHNSSNIYDSNGLAPTISARDYKGPKQIAVREATKRGYAIAEQGDSVNVTYPDSKTRRGRVGKQVAQTLQAGEVNQGVVMGGDFDDKEIERNTLEILQTLQKEIGEKEIAKWKSRILDTFQQEEILRQDVYEKRLDIEQDEKKLERKEQSCECEVKNRTFDKQERMREMPINKEFRCSSHGRGSIQQFARELTSIMQKLSHETSQEKNLHRLRETTQGNRLLRKALSEIQEIWRPSLYEEQSLRIRKLVPIETWRLQGFTDEQFDKAQQAGLSNSQLYKQAGNAVTVNVVKYIADHLLEED